MTRPRLLLSIASRQTWPQILAVAHLKPERVILLHSAELDESKRPAQKLKRFFDGSGLVPRGATRMEEIPHDDFRAVEAKLHAVSARYDSGEYPVGAADQALHFTGGNKLMATAAFRWATAHGIPSFYLERGNRLSWFESNGDGPASRSEALDGHLTDHLDPLELLRCQSVESIADGRGEGELLRINERGQALADAEFFAGAQGKGALRYLHRDGQADHLEKAGDGLEYQTAAVLLKLGVRHVRRSVELKVQGGRPTRHAEFDLLFNWGGRLWLVDCKDRRPAQDLVKGLRRELPEALSDEAGRLLDRIGEELDRGATKALKEDLLGIQEIGGLLGKVVCVRKSELPPEARNFARRHHIEVVLKNALVDGFRTLLYPGQPASEERLKALEGRFDPGLGRGARG